MNHFLTLSTLCLILPVSVATAVDGRTIVVSPAGNDAAAGNAEQPLRTISAAAALAQPGDTVLVKAGIYRERVAPPRGGEPGRPITYRGEKLGTVFIRGSEEWKPAWQAHAGSVFSAVPGDELFDDDVYVDSASPLRVELASTPYGRDGKPEAERGIGTPDPDMVYTCGQLIVNGKPWEQRPFLTEVETRPGTWSFAADSGRLYVNFGDLAPEQQQVEITARRRIFAPHIRGLGHLVVEGFVMEHCGNQYPTNFWKTKAWAQAGAVGLRSGHHWVVRNNVIRYANADALDIGIHGGDNERESAAAPGAPIGEDNLIEKNYIMDNGAGGITGSVSTRVIIRNNVILRNNKLGFIGKKRYEHAGIKAHNPQQGLIEHNYVADNPLSDGIWMDNHFTGARVTRNVVVNNGRRGIFLEMSDYQFDVALVDHNISIGNDIQFYVHDASGSTVMHNLFANSPATAQYGQGTYIRQVQPRTKTGYHSLYNNLFINHKVMLDINYPAHRGGPQRLDHNVYDAPSGARVFLVNRESDVPSPWQPEEFFLLVKNDVGLGEPEPLEGGAKVALTLDEWRAFWEKHGQRNDRHSVALEGMKVSYDQATFTLKVTLPFDPGGIKATVDDRIDHDFQGVAVARDGSAKPGPIQSLKRGENTFNVWDGLPLLAEGELPR